MNRNLLTVAVCTALALPLSLSQTALGVSSSRQEYSQARHEKPNLDRGAELFRTCVACHGPTGQGVVDGTVPRIGGQHVSVLIEQLVDYRHGKRWDPRMEHFADQHHLTNAQAVADVAAYVSRLESTSEDRLGVGPGDLVERGEALYSRSCASCHGTGGEGNAKEGIPQVAGQHYEYLRRQIYDAVDGRRPNFSSAHIRLFAQLDHDDIAGVADFLARTPRKVDLGSLQNLAATPR